MGAVSRCLVQSASSKGVAAVFTGDLWVTYPRPDGRPRLRLARGSDPPAPAGPPLRARRPNARGPGRGGARNDPVWRDATPARPGGGGSRDDAPRRPREAPLPEPGPDPAAPRPLARQVPGAGGRLPDRPATRAGEPGGNLDALDRRTCLCLVDLHPRHPGGDLARVDGDRFHGPLLLRQRHRVRLAAG